MVMGNSPKGFYKLRSSTTLIYYLSKTLDGYAFIFNHIHLPLDLIKSITMTGLYQSENPASDRCIIGSCHFCIFKRRSFFNKSVFLLQVVHGCFCFLFVVMTGAFVSVS